MITLGTADDEGCAISVQFESNAPAVDAVLDRLLTLHPKRIDLSLERIEGLLERLGHPNRSLPPVIHVAGTNGKGSTVAFLRACLEAAGYRVHAYTSPHLVRFNERIRLAGALISDDYLIDVLERAEAANAGAEITFFEITTAAAFLAYAETPADVLLLETGLGGRLDTTNVVDHPAMTAITRISMDHMQFLGGTLAEIAAEKAGILKPGVPVVLAPQRSGPVIETIRGRAAEIGAPLLSFGADWHYEMHEDGMSVWVGDEEIRLPRPNLTGAHQIQNAATAVLCLRHLHGLDVPVSALATGLTSAEWPARLQRLSRGPLVERLPDGWELWLDGGHNDSAGEVVAEWLGGLDRRPTHLVVGILSTKDPRDLLRPLAPFASSLRAIAIPGEPATLAAADLAAAAREVGVPNVAVSDSLPEAIDAIVEAGNPEITTKEPLPAAVEAILTVNPTPARVLISGSLYLAGQVLSDHA